MSDRRERQQEERELAAARQANLDIQQREDLRWLMSSKQGRRVLWQVLSLSGVYRLSYTGEAIGGAFNEGRRAVGFDLSRRALRASEGGYALMFQENVADLAGAERDQSDG